MFGKSAVCLAALVAVLGTVGVVAAGQIEARKAKMKEVGKNFGEDLGAMINAGLPADFAALKVSLGSVAQNCKASRTDYRIEKN